MHIDRGSDGAADEVHGFVGIGGGEYVVYLATGVGVDFIYYDTSRRLLPLNGYHNI